MTLDLENLFKWNNSFEVKDRNGKTVEINGEPLILYQRIIGDAELTEARRQALYASRELRKKLKDEASRERAILLPEYDEMTNDELKNAIILTEGPQLRLRAEEVADMPKYPVKPQDDSLEAQEEYQVEMDSYEERCQNAIDKQLEKLIENRKNDLKGIRKENLQEMFINAVIKTIARSRMLEVFNHWCAYLGTYTDKAMKQRAFRNFEGFNNASTELKQQIIGYYVDLEFGGGELKKSPSAMNSEESGSSQEN